MIDVFTKLMGYWETVVLFIKYIRYPQHHNCSPNLKTWPLLSNITNQTSLNFLQLLITELFRHRKIINRTNIIWNPTILRANGWYKFSKKFDVFFWSIRNNDNIPQNLCMLQDILYHLALTIYGSKSEHLQMWWNTWRNLKSCFHQLIVVFILIDFKLATKRIHTIYEIEKKRKDSHKTK